MIVGNKARVSHLLPVTVQKVTIDRRQSNGKIRTIPYNGNSLHLEMTKGNLWKMIGSNFYLLLN